MPDSRALVLTDTICFHIRPNKIFSGLIQPIPQRVSSG